MPVDVLSPCMHNTKSAGRVATLARRNSSIQSTVAEKVTITLTLLLLL